MIAELTIEKVRIPGSCGTLAGELTYPSHRTSFAALLVNPHPHMGGRSGNALLVRLAEHLACGGGVVLSFDYSGVGESDGPRIDVAKSMSQFWQSGSAPEDRRMVDDVEYALAWIAKQARLPLVLIGYSFGAYAATAVLADNVEAVVLISPTVKQHDFSALQEHTIAKLVVHGDNDFATPHADLQTWMTSLPQPLRSRWIPSGDHFFRGQEDTVAGACLDFAHETLGMAAT